MIRVLSIYSFLLILILGSYSQIFPAFSLGELSLLSIALLLQSFLHITLHWKKVLSDTPFIHKVELVSLKPGLLVMVVLFVILFFIFFIWAQMLYRLGMYKRDSELVLLFIFVFIACERLPIMIWQYGYNRHWVLFGEDQLLYSGYYLQRLKLKQLSGIKGEWKILRGDKEKWQLDEFSEIKFTSYPFKGISLPLKYLRLGDEQKLLSAIGEVIRRYNPPVSEKLQLLKIEAIGRE